MTNLLLHIAVLSILIGCRLVCYPQAPRLVSDFSLKPTDLLKTRPDTEIKNLRVTMPDEPAPLGRVLYRLAFQTGIPIGLEVADFDDWEAFEYDPYLVILRSGDRAGWQVMGETPGWRIEPIRSFSLNTNHSRFEDVLDDLVAQMQSYRWEIRDGVVNIFPKRRKSKLIKEFLETEIRNFKFPKGKSIKRLMDSMYELTELERFSIAPAIGGTLGEDKFTLSEDVEFSNITVKELLNRLSRINMCGWVVSSLERKEVERIWLGI